MNYYIAVDNQTYGPYTAAQFPEMFASGSVGYQSLVCREGETAWQPVAAIAAELGLPPEPGAQRPAIPPRPVRRQVVAAPRPPRESGAFKGIRLGSLIAALGLFFLPWIEVQCTGKGMIVQSGYQTVVRDASPAKDMREMAKAMGEDPDKEFNSKKMKEDKDAPAPAWMVAVAAGLILLAIVVGLGAATRISGILALGAAAVLAVQIVIGFPVERKVKEMTEAKMPESKPAKTKSAADVLGGVNNPGQPTPSEQQEAEDAMKRMMITKMMAEFKVVVQPWLWAEFGLLALAGALGFMRPRE